jgi:hypothetical protein
MDAITFLEQEHRKAKDMFRQIEQAPDQQRVRLWNSLKPELKLHEQMEEAHLYGPVAQDNRIQDSSLRDWNQRHHQEVSELESLIQEVGADAANAQWLDKIKAVRSTLENQIQEEEQQIWPKIRQSWDQTRLDEAGRKMEAMKKEAKPKAAAA